METQMKTIFKGMLFMGIWGLIVCDGNCGEIKELSPAEVVSILKNNDVDMQEKALKSLWGTAALKNKYKTPEVQQALYELLVKTAKPTDSFGGFIYAPIPIRIMCALGQFNETRTLTYLLNNIKWGGCVIDSLARIGEPAVPPMLDKLLDGDLAEKSEALGFLEILFSTRAPTVTNAEGQIFANPYKMIYTPKGVTREKIRAAIKESLNDKNSVILHVSIRVLKMIDNPEDKALLEEKDKKDPHRKTPEKIAKQKALMKTMKEQELRKMEERRSKGLPEYAPDPEGD